MLKLVIFDMDGLMFDTEAVMLRAFLEVTKEQDLGGSRDQFISLLGLSSRDIKKKYLEYFGPDVDAEALYRLCGERKLSILEKEGIPVKEGLPGLLDEIDRLGIMKAVASSSDEQTIRDNLKRAGILDRFDYILSAGSIKRGKPFPDIFLQVVRALAVSPEETLVLEDSANGVQAAYSGNIPVIQIPDLVEPTAEISRKCLAVRPSLKSVIPMLSHYRS